MLFYVLRVAWLLLRQSFKPPVGPGDTFEISFRAWPWYCDTNWHVNNAHYLTFMEYARWAMAVRSGMLRRAVAERLVFLLGGASVLYRRPLPMFRRFTLRTSLIATDERWLTMAHDFVDHRGRVAARALARGMIRDARGPLPLREILGASSPSAAAAAELAAFEALTRQHLAQIPQEARTSEDQGRENATKAS